MDEASARRVVLVQAYDAADTPLWTPEDRDWADRLAAQTAPAGASSERLIAERAHHALQRLLPRDAALRRALARSPWRWRWLAGVAVAASVIGLLADLIGRQIYIDLLAAPLWALLGWNLAVYALLAWSTVRSGPVRTGALRRWLAARWQQQASRGPLHDGAARWARLAAPLNLQRAAAVLHTAAAALALGMIAGLYLRALVFDFRVGWQSTFLEPATVRSALAMLFAPASAVTAIPVPDVAAIGSMRITPDAPQASASAAPWIHLMSATLMLVVVLPRAVLAVLAFMRAWAGSRRVALPLDAPAFEPLLRRHRGGPAQVRVLPYAAAPGARAALGLRALLARLYGEDLQLQMADTTPIGDEESATIREGGRAVTLRLALADLGATPESEHHGRFVQALQAAVPAAPVLVVVDEAAFVQRFAGLDGRVDERRTAWRSWAAALPVPLLCVDLGTTDLAAAETALRLALRA